MRHGAAIAGALALAWLSGCATTPGSAPELAGRLAVRVEAFEGAPARSLSTQFELRGNAQAGELQLTTPLGSTAAQARWRPGAVPAAVALVIAAGYWWTASTSFANPAITVARALSDTFAGVRPADAPGFIVGQGIGALAACGVWRLAAGAEAPRV